VQLTLNDLDVAFNNLWQHQNQFPTLLETWREMVFEYLETIHPETPNKSEVAEKIQYWECVLSHYKPANSVYYDSSTVH
jgi:hypothetical protein